MGKVGMEQPTGAMKPFVCRARVGCGRNLPNHGLQSDELDGRVVLNASKSIGEGQCARNWTRSR